MIWNHGNHGCHMLEHEGRTLGSVQLQRQNRERGRLYNATIWGQKEDGLYFTIEHRSDLKYKDALAYVESHGTWRAKAKKV